MAPQWTATKGPARRGLAACSASATSSLPVPLGPSTRTGRSAGPTRRTMSFRRRIAGLAPNMRSSSRECRRRVSSCSKARLASARETTKRSKSGSTGLARKSQAPAATARKARSWSPWAVSTTTGTATKSGISFSPASTVRSGGMTRSRITRSGRSRRNASRASAPSRAVTHAMPLLLQPGRGEAQKGGLVVDEQDGAGAHAGNLNVKHVLQPGRWPSVTSPPWAAMTLATMASPRPVPPSPRDTNGRNNEARMSAGMPGPSSHTWIRIAVVRSAPPRPAHGRRRRGHWTAGCRAPG